MPFLDSHGDEGARLRPAAVLARRPIGTRGSPTREGELGRTPWSQRQQDSSQRKMLWHYVPGG